MPLAIMLNMPSALEQISQFLKTAWDSWRLYATTDQDARTSFKELIDHHHRWKHIETLMHVFEPIQTKTLAHQSTFIQYQ